MNIPPNAECTVCYDSGSIELGLGSMVRMCEWKGKSGQDGHFVHEKCLEKLIASGWRECITRDGREIPAEYIQRFTRVENTQPRVQQTSRTLFFIGVGVFLFMAYTYFRRRID